MASEKQNVSKQSELSLPKLTSYVQIRTIIVTNYSDPRNTLSYVVAKFRCILLPNYGQTDGHNILATLVQSFPVAKLVLYSQDIFCIFIKPYFLINLK